MKREIFYVVILGIILVIAGIAYPGFSISKIFEPQEVSDPISPLNKDIINNNTNNTDNNISENNFKLSEKYLPSINGITKDLINDNITKEDIFYDPYKKKYDINLNNSNLQKYNSSILSKKNSRNIKNINNMTINSRYNYNKSRKSNIYSFVNFDRDIKRKIDLKNKKILMKKESPIYTTNVYYSNKKIYERSNYNIKKFFSKELSAVFNKSQNLSKNNSIKNNTYIYNKKENVSISTENLYYTNVPKLFSKTMNYKLVNETNNKIILYSNIIEKEKELFGSTKVSHNKTESILVFDKNRKIITKFRFRSTLIDNKSNETIPYYIKYNITNINNTTVNKPDWVKNKNW